ncbi:actin-interacting protein 1 isoform X2 [Octopus vulgaris]|uniref:Actin-interacting protein 1 isoform X2 n=1 Tax=Octopus vulgaris TaxID=6645 RepID=A0AA36BR28_OCTVU|nr:actin-interacting protein 1 isoform X2 [Octopus vulgaris]
MSYTLKTTFPTLPRTQRGMPIVLGADPKGKYFLYTNGHNVVIRDIENPNSCDMYTEHSGNVMVAKYSPSGFYIASGGSSVGEISGHSKQINSCDYRQMNPFRVVTASEDYSVVMCEGPPFKFTKKIDAHTNFVNCIRYSPNGEKFISGGADGKAFVYDGKNGESIGELGSPAHKGGIYGDCETTFPTLPRTQRGMPIVLGADPKGKYFLYTNGHNVVIRDIENPNSCDMYTEHSGNVMVAKYSPSGFYIASGDDRGKIRIWDTINPEHVLSKEYQPIAGTIKDIAWSPDNKRMLVAGDGKGTFARAFLVDTGSSVGEISGHSKQINSCDYRQMNPFRVVTASEDYSVVMCEGPPFKFTKKIDAHTNFVNCIRYSPNGEKFISGGADGKAFVYDGKNGESIGELGSPAHKGGIYGIAFSPDNSEVLTVSGDKTAKIWDANTYTLVKEFVFGKTLDDMLVSCIWIGNNIITISLSGFITYLDRNCPEKPLRVLKGHNKPITALTTTPDRKLVFSGCSSGHINILLSMFTVFVILCSLNVQCVHCFIFIPDL